MEVETVREGAATKIYVVCGVGFSVHCPLLSERTLLLRGANTPFQTIICSRIITRLCRPLTCRKRAGRGRGIDSPLPDQGSLLPLRKCKVAGPLSGRSSTTPRRLPDKRSLRLVSLREGKLTLPHKCTCHCETNLIRIIYQLSLSSSAFAEFLFLSSSYNFSCHLKKPCKLLKV